MEVIETKWSLDCARVTGFIEPASAGDARVERFTVSKADSDFSRIAAMNRGRGFVPVGEYTALYHRNALWMSDTPDELYDHGAILHRGEGRILINGLGLGCVVRGLLAKEAVEHIDVVERSADIIALVGDYYAGERCTIHHADALTKEWPKRTRWDFAWHDIWQDLCGDNLTEYAALKRKYARRVGWQGCWGESFVRRYSR